MHEVMAEADEDHDVIRTKGHGLGERQEKRPAKDRDDAGRGRQVEFADWVADDRRAPGDHHAFNAGVAQTQFALHRQQIFVSQFDLELPNLAFNDLQGGLLSLDPI